MMCWSVRALVVGLLVAGIRAEMDASTIATSKYCVIGAGPAGVQMGQLLLNEQADYVVFERGPRAGTFFNKFPISRRFNSFNRRNVRSNNTAFMLRHDWHTLVENDECPPFTEFDKTKAFWPAADTFVEYLNDFVEVQVKADRVRYCHTVSAIKKITTGHGDAAVVRYELAIKVLSPCDEESGWDGMSRVDEGSVVKTHECEVLVMADGMAKPNDPEHGAEPFISGLDLTVGYDQLRKHPDEDFEAKRVMILGCGNAAFETADSLRNYAADIVTFCRSGVTTSEASRYAGDVRGPMSMGIDTGKLGALEMTVDSEKARENVEITHDSGDGMSPTRIPSPQFVVVPCGNAKMFSDWPESVDIPATGFKGESPRCVFERDGDSGLIILGWANKDYWQVTKAKELFGEDLIIQKASRWFRLVHKSLMRIGGFGDHHNTQGGGAATTPRPYHVMMMNYTALRRPLSQAQLDLLAECMQLQKGLHRRGYQVDKSFDVIISSLGWVYDDAPFKNGNTTLKLTGLSENTAHARSNVYPDLAGTHASISTENVYFVGANAHGLDRKRYQASGGFIGGFRFTTRTVFRTIMEKYEGKPNLGKAVFDLPVLSSDSGQAAHRFQELMVEPVWKHLLTRLIFSAASMVGGSLLDGIAFVDGKCLYMEDFAEDVFHDLYNGSKRLTLSLYAGGHSPLLGGRDWFRYIRIPEQAGSAHPFHPVFEFWPEGVAPAKEILESTHHPSSVWKGSRGSNRFHFKADRLFDFTNILQVPLLDTFLKDIVTTVTNGEVGQHLELSYHETSDSRDRAGSRSERETGRAGMF